MISTFKEIFDVSLETKPFYFFCTHFKIAGGHGKLCLVLPPTTHHRAVLNEKFFSLLSSVLNGTKEREREEFHEFTSPNFVELIYPFGSHSHFSPSHPWFNFFKDLLAKGTNEREE
jgi:hypothetical protein